MLGILKDNIFGELNEQTIEMILNTHKALEGVVLGLTIAIVRFIRKCIRYAVDESMGANASFSMLSFNTN